MIDLYHILRVRGLLMLVLASALSGSLIQAGQRVAAAGSAEPRTVRAVNLAAGPIRLKFADGELRYLYVGDKEIIRRIYFSVRDTVWDTPSPRFTKVDVRSGADNFEVNLSAVVKQGAIDFTWNGKIVGAADGQITYRVDGQANADFKCNRFGFCVLYGSASMEEQRFEMTDDKGGTSESVFPKRIPPGIWPHSFRSLRYVTASGMEVVTSLTPVLFGLEDQRNWSDSSFKAFSAMDYPYPNIVKGATGTETVTVKILNPQATAAPAGPVRVTIGAPVKGARLPKLIPLDSEARKGFFLDVTTHRDQYRQAATVTWPFTPAVNLFDDDTLIENLPTLRDQAETARTFAPFAVFRVAPLRFNPYWERPNRDPRNLKPFAAAWLASAVKYLAMGGVAEVMPDVGPAYAELLQKRLVSHEGAGILSVTVEGPPRPIVDALAIEDGADIVVWLANLSDDSQKDIELNLPSARNIRLGRINETTKLDADLPMKVLGTARSQLRLDLAPYEVREIKASSK